MSRNAYLLVPVLAALSGCSTPPPKPEKPLDKIQGKIQQNMMETTATDVALNAGGPSTYLLDGVHHYRLFFRKNIPIDPNREYIAEGVYAQKVIDEIGDPDQGKNGYPLQSSCERVVTTAWPGLAMDVNDTNSSVLCARIKRYPARPVFLVKNLTPVPTKEGEAKKTEAADNTKPITVPADKQRALLEEGPTTLTAPLWQPAGGTVSCKLLIGKDGKISELETGAQLCESVPWEKFRYKPTAKAGHPVEVLTEVEVRFEPLKSGSGV